MCQNTSPMYQKIMQSIINDISKGVYDRGSMIPSQKTLAEKFNVNRVVIREVINNLVNRGILETTRGRGTIVVGPTGEYAHMQHSIDFSSALDKQVAMNSLESPAPDFQSKVLVLEDVVPVDYIQRKLGMPKDAMAAKIIRLRYINGIPTAYQTSYFSRHMIGPLDFQAADLEHGSLYDFLKNSIGVHFTNYNEVWDAVICPDEVASYLEIGAEPVLSMTRVTYTAFDVPMEYCENYQRTDIWKVNLKYI